MPSVFDYLDYRRFLADWFDEQKRRNPFFSYRYLGGRLGVDAGNLVKILQNERHLPKKAVDPVAAQLKLGRSEEAYFRTLVAFGRSRRESQTRVLFERLVSLRDGQARKVQPHQYEFYRAWHHTAVLALLDFYDFGGDYAALARQLEPPITAAQAKESLALLQRLGMLRKDDRGFPRPVSALMSSGDTWRSLAIRQFQEETLRLAGRALQACPQDERDISTVSVTVAGQDIAEVRRLTREYRTAVMKVAQACESPERVYQLNVQFFPLTKKREDAP